MGGAPRARPEYRRMMSASDRQRLAPFGRLSPSGLLRPRSGQTAGVGLEVPARTLTHRIRRFMSATGPDRSCAPHPPCQLAQSETRPGGWLCTVDRPPASGTPMASASPRTSPHVTANPERPSSHLNRSVRDPSGSGSAMMMARGLEGVEKILLGGFFTDGAACLLSPSVGRKQNHDLSFS